MDTWFGHCLSAYSWILFRKVRIEIPSSFAAATRLPSHGGGGQYPISQLLADNPTEMFAFACSAANVRWWLKRTHSSARGCSSLDGLT
jgi:hypothetical protein